jgi:hypothetical protein
MPQVMKGALGLALPLLISCSSSPSGGNVVDGGTPDATQEASVGSACSDPSEVKLWGLLDTTNVDQTYTSPGSNFAAGVWDLRFGSKVIFTEGAGQIHVTLTSGALQWSGTPIASGWLWMPKEGPYPDAVFCVGDGVLGQENSSVYTFTLKSLSRAASNGAAAFDDAGACAGTPVAGEITGCARK